VQQRGLPRTRRAADTAIKPDKENAMLLRAVPPSPPHRYAFAPLLLPLIFAPYFFSLCR